MSKVLSNPTHSMIIWYEAEYFGRKKGRQNSLIKKYGLCKFQNSFQSCH